MLVDLALSRYSVMFEFTVAFVLLVFIISLARSTESDVGVGEPGTESVLSGIYMFVAFASSSLFYKYEL